MKKFLVVLSMITCIFGMTACGTETTVSSVQQDKVKSAETYAYQFVVPFFLGSAADMDEFAADFTNDEIGTIYSQSLGLDVTGGKFNATGSVIKSGCKSIQSGMEITGPLTVANLGQPTSRIDHETIIVTIPVVDASKDAEIEVILSNDFFLNLESVALNVQYTFGETMAKAGQNTLIGIGTVFVMLVLISVIISLFAYIPKIQESLSKKKESPKTQAIENTVAQIVEKEEAAASEEDLTDDLELVAVIAAAIAAYEGQSSTEGFTVRSIRKVNRR